MSNHRSKVKLEDLPVVGVVKDFPVVGPGQVVVMCVHKQLGCVLNTAGDISRGRPEDEVHAVCADVDAARQLAQRLVTEYSHMVCVLYSSGREELEVIRRPDSPRSV